MEDLGIDHSDPDRWRLEEDFERVDRFVEPPASYLPHSAPSAGCTAPASHVISAAFLVLETAWQPVVVASASASVAYSVGHFAAGVEAGLLTEWR